MKFRVAMRLKNLFSTYCVHVLCSVPPPFSDIRRSEITTSYLTSIRMTLFQTVREILYCSVLCSTVQCRGGKNDFVTGTLYPMDFEETLAILHPAFLA